jgi:ribosomal-protein-serine acetyltransferase
VVNVGRVTIDPFGRDLGGGWSLTLRDLGTVEVVHALIVRNLARLRAAEPWAWEEPGIEQTVLQTERLLAKYAMDQAVPCVIRRRGDVVGVVTLAIDAYLQGVSLGYWIDAGHEGAGGVRRSAEALLAVAAERGLHRAEIRTAVDNVRCRGLAERLGFVLEGTLRSALPLGERRVDVALYGALLPVRPISSTAWPGSDDARTTTSVPSTPMSSDVPSTRASSSPSPR